MALQGADAAEAIADADDTEALILDEADIVDPDSEDLEYFGLLSKEDIEALLHGDLIGNQGEDAQNEIDSLLATAGSEKDAASPAAGERFEEENAARDDVEQLIEKTTADVHRKTEIADAEVPATESETSEGTDAVSQDDIDRLLMSAIDDPEEDIGHGLEDGEVALEEGGAVSQDDIDQLLKGDVDPIDADTEVDFGEAPIETEASSVNPSDTGDLVSQAELDRLMGEALSQGEAEETSLQEEDTTQEHISQNDINRLLKESLEEEGLPEEEAAEEHDTVDEIETVEPVILAVDEEVDDSPPAVPALPPASPPRKKAPGRFKKKRLLVGVSACVVLVLAVSIMTMLPGPKETVRKPQVLTFSVPRPEEAGQSAQPVSAKSVRLNGFVVLAPPNPTAVTYMTGDLLLDLSDASLVDLIKENEAYVRDIVYGTINRELMTRDISTIDEISLELAIRKELGRIIPRGAIERIDFEKILSGVIH